MATCGASSRPITSTTTREVRHNNNRRRHNNNDDDLRRIELIPERVDRPAVGAARLRRNLERTHLHGIDPS